MRIGIIGAGTVGTTLGRAWAKAGHAIVYGTRESGRAAPHDGATVDSVRGAAASADVVALVTPWSAAADALGQAGDLAGKPLLDVTNPIGPGLSLALGHTTSGGEEIARLAPSARVVKAFNTTGFENMANPVYGETRALMPVAGDDPAAVALAAKLASDIGFASVSLPGLRRARELEPFALLWIKLAMQLGLGRNMAYAVHRRASGEAAPALGATKTPRAITVVGSGNIGGALAKAWLRAGHRVRIAARDANAPDVAALVALGAEAIPIEGAAAGAEVVVFAIPAGAVLETAARLGALDGKIVVDCTNAIAKGFTLQYGHDTSWAEVVAKELAGARVVRAFHQQGAEVLQNPRFSGIAATNFVAGDDPEARRVVAGLSLDVGLDTVEAGPLANARLLEPITLLWVAMAQSLGTREFGLSLARRAP